jgi:replicative DNA helicase
VHVSGDEGSTVDVVSRETRLVSLADTLTDVDTRLRSGAATDVRTVPSGFKILDGVLGGGLHTGELLLLGGAPGVGKTIMALQMARNIAREGSQVYFACFEHEPSILLARLLAMEAGFVMRSESLSRTVLDAMTSGDMQGRPLVDVLTEIPGGAESLAAIESYRDSFTFIEASGARTTIDELSRIVRERQDREKHTLLFVDYLQKIPLHPEPETEAEKVTRTVEALKDLAMDEHISVVLLSAIDSGGMNANRVRIHHLRGSTAAAFEADVVLMLNDKFKAVSKVHLTYDAVRARTFRDYLIVSVEKNRGGPSLVDLEFRKDFAHFRIEPTGTYVTDKLIDERLDEALV